MDLKWKKNENKECGQWAAVSLRFGKKKTKKNKDDLRTSRGSILYFIYLNAISSLFAISSFFYWIVAIPSA